MKNLRKIKHIALLSLMISFISIMFLSSPVEAKNKTGTLRIPELSAVLTVKAWLSSLTGVDFQVSADYRSTSDNPRQQTPNWIKIQWSFEATRLSGSAGTSGISIGAANAELSSKAGSWTNSGNAHSSHRGKISIPDGVSSIRLTARASILCDGVTRSVEVSV